MKKIDKEKVKQWFKMKLWTEEMILEAVEKEALTQEDADEILASSF